MLEYTVLHLFSGIGGAALGFQEAKAEYKGLLGSFRTLAGIDCDPEACRDFETITGAPAVEMDLFSRKDYIEFHGKQPPREWVEVTPHEIVDVTNGEYPDVIFLSPPCKGFSGLLPNKKAKSEKYQALNRLVLRGLKLILDAYMDDLPSVIMLENVPRITSRGDFLLRHVKQLLGRHGYVFHEGTHDCGELGGLGQHRKRYLLIARLPDKMPSFIYRPPTRRVKSIGEIIGPLAFPDDPTMGPMHRLPRLQWKTWVRLAIIPAGGDWRDMENVGSYQIEHVKRGSGSFGVQEWDNPGHTVIGNSTVGGTSPVSISDPRLTNRESRHPGVYQVLNMDEHAPCVTGTRFGSGAPAVADNRVPFNNVFRITKWDDTPGAVTSGNGQTGTIVGDPRLNITNGHQALYRVSPWQEPANTVTGAHGPNNGAITVADPRVKAGQYPGGYGVIDWDDPAPTVRSAGRVVNAPISVADPRLSCEPRNGTMGVQPWNQPSKTIIGSGDIHAGAAAVADPRIPKDTEVLDPPPIIIALDGTWHRPLTTLELVALQGFPIILANGQPLQLAGNSDARWRERIGNAVPPPTARAIGEEILLALMSAKDNLWMLSSAGIWVHSETVVENAEVLQ
ncbi:MAG: DNA cytosine methyltransferase [Syntrophomonadales bacterium]|jgi:site-specific DNA-cytosine methylase